MTPPPPRPTPFPYTTLFRSNRRVRQRDDHRHLRRPYAARHHDAGRRHALRRARGGLLRVALVLAVDGFDGGHWALPCELPRSEEHTSELQSQSNLVCRLLLE